MTSEQVIDKITLRLNKLASNDYQNIHLWVMEEAVNKAVLDFVRRQLKGKNSLREGDEETSFIVDDFAVLLDRKSLELTNASKYTRGKIPETYLSFKRLSPNVKKGDCERDIKSSFIEEANVDEFLQDFNSRPSFDFEETFHTEESGYFNIYHNNDFEISKIMLIFYRKPKFIDLHNKDYILEFKDDTCELIIDEAVKLIAGDIENSSQYQIAEKRIENNN